MDSGTSWRYRPALDGVRALAVTAVLVFHARPGWLPGGFLGVDVFFVLSGFLITSLLLTEARTTGTIRLAEFWGRRARRLLPALLLMLITVAITARYLRPAPELAALRWDVLAALAGVANWRMIVSGGDYFAHTFTYTAPPSLLQHTWSLGIGGQFYLLWPLVVAWALRRRLSRSALLAVCLAGTGAAGLLTAVLYRPGGDAARVYYGTDTRAGALLAGCALAVWLTGRTVRHTRWLAVAAGFAAVTLVAAMIATNGESAWLYLGGLTAVALAVAVTLAHLVTSPGSYATLLLSLSPVVWVGRISYGLYLWHWPVFSALHAGRTGLTGLPLFALRVAVTLAVATASYYLLEQPVRRGVGRRLIPLAATAITATAAVVIFDAFGAGAPASRPTSVSQAQGAPATPPGPPPVTRPDRAEGPPRITVFGDSAAWTLGEYLLPVRDDLDITSRAFTGCGIARLPDIRVHDAPYALDPECEHWDDGWRRSVEEDDPDVAVILLGQWEVVDRTINGRYLHVGDPDFDAYLTGELKRAISIASAKGARVVLLTTAYRQLAGSAYPEDAPERVDAWNRLLTREAATNPTHPTILDLNRLLCPDGVYTPSSGGVRLRGDDGRFTPEAVQEVITPWLLPRLRELATQ